MKKLFAVLSLVMVVTAATAQNQGIPHRFTGELITVPAIAPNCGTIASASVYEFKITMLSDGAYTEENIAIIISCPELNGANFFKVGATYKMELFETSDGQYSISNQTVLDNYTLPQNYWAGDIKRIQ